MQTEAVTIQLTAEDVQDCTDFAKELERTCFENGYKQKYGQFSKEQNLSILCRAISVSEQSENTLIMRPFTRHIT